SRRGIVWDWHRSGPARHPNHPLIDLVFAEEAEVVDQRGFAPVRSESPQLPLPVEPAQTRSEGARYLPEKGPLESPVAVRILPDDCAKQDAFARVDVDHERVGHADGAGEIPGQVLVRDFIPDHQDASRADAQFTGLHQVDADDFTRDGDLTGPAI